MGCQASKEPRPATGTPPRLYESVDVYSGLRCPNYPCRTVFALTPTEHQPITCVPCNHSLCKLCHDGLQQAYGDGFACPMCGVPVQLHVVNYALATAGTAVPSCASEEIGTAASTPADSAMCTACVANHFQERATHYCYSCDSRPGLCDEHAALHSKQLKDHNVSPTAGSPHNEQVGNSLACQSHKKNSITHVCVECVEPLCPGCDLGRHFRECKTVLLLQDALPRLRDALAQHQSRLGQIRNEMLKSLPKVTAALHELGRKAAERRSKIEAAFSEIRSFVDTTERQMMCVHKTAVEFREKSLEAQARSLDVGMNQLSATLDVCCGLLTSEPDPIKLSLAIKSIKSHQPYTYAGLDADPHLDTSVHIPSVKKSLNNCWNLVSTGDAMPVNPAVIAEERFRELETQVVALSREVETAAQVAKEGYIHNQGVAIAGERGRLDLDHDPLHGVNLAVIALDPVQQREVDRHLSSSETVALIVQPRMPERRM